MDYFIGWQNICNRTASNLERDLLICCRRCNCVANHHDIVTTRVACVSRAENTFICPETYKYNRIGTGCLQFFIQIGVAILIKVPKHIQMFSIVEPTIGNLLLRRSNFGQGLHARCAVKNIHSVLGIFRTQTSGTIPPIHRVADAVVKRTGPGTPHDSDTVTLRLGYPKCIHKLDEIRKNTSSIRPVLFLTVIQKQGDSTRPIRQIPGSPKTKRLLIRATWRTFVVVH